MRRVGNLCVRLFVWAGIVGHAVLFSAQTPYPTLYGSIGDRIFEAAAGYKALLDTAYFAGEEGVLRPFLEKAQKARAAGFELEKASGDKEGRLVYIRTLRVLEQEQKTIDGHLLEAIDRLGSGGDTSVLETLKTNPYGPIRMRVESYLVAPVIENGDLPPLDLKRSLEGLKQRLMEARATGASQEQCLNDITAVNYWMLDAERARYRRAWCRAYDAAQQTVNFEASARGSCGEKRAIYEEWRKRSLPYRTTLRTEFETQCR